MHKKIYLLFILSLISQLVFSQNYKKAFNALQDKNYTSARVIFSSALKKADSKAVGEYGMAVVYRNTSLRVEDMYRSYASIIEAKRGFNTVNAKLKKKYSRYFNEDKIEAEFVLIDASLFKMVKAKDEVKAYQKHIDKCKESKFRQQSMDLRNAKAYKVAVGFNTIPAYKDFCDKYPKSKEFAQAQATMFTMAWSECEIYDDIAKYKDFINKYPQAPQVSNAKDNIRKKEYKVALDINTQAAFDSFIAKYPKSAEAKSLKGQGVKSAFANVEKFKSISVCESFLQDYPNSEFSARVTTIRDSLAYEAVLEKNTPEAYTAFIETYPNAIQVPLVMDKMGKLLYSKEELQIKRAKFAIKKHQIVNVKVYKGESTEINTEKRYDIYGNCFYEFENVLDDYSEMKKYFYDQAGDKLLKEQLFVNNKIKSITEYNYDVKGLKTTASTVCNFNCLDNAKLSVDSFIYDNKRNLLSKKTFGDSSKLIESHAYTYDSKGNRVGEEFEIIAADKYNTYKISYNYNGKGYIIQKTTANSQGVNTEVESYSYDGLDKVISSSRYDYRGTLMRTYFYNAKGLVESETHTYENDDAKNTSYVWKYELRK